MRGQLHISWRGSTRSLTTREARATSHYNRGSRRANEDERSQCTRRFADGTSSCYIDCAYQRADELPRRRAKIGAVPIENFGARDARRRQLQIQLQVILQKGARGQGELLFETRRLVHLSRQAEWQLYR